MNSARDTSCVTILAAVLGAGIAVVGWVVNNALARRAERRTMRIEYLLTAYRRLEHASNRAMTPGHAAELEGAISDIQLLGSPVQVDLAKNFAADFASVQTASTEELLEDLRQSLREELQLKPSSPGRVWLRLNLDSGAVEAHDSANARFERLSGQVAERVESAIAGGEIPGGPGAADIVDFPRRILELADERSPLGAIASAETAVVAELRSLLGGSGLPELDELRPSGLARLAFDRGLIGGATRDAIDGILVMHSMAALDDGGRRLGRRDVEHFASLCQGILLALRLPFTPDVVAGPAPQE